MHDFIIVGGGVIGLSLAYELAGAARRVLVVERGRLGRATSWAGAGICPPPRRHARHDPLEQLRTLSHELHHRWSADLLAETGVDNQLRRRGGIYLARRAAESAALVAEMRQAADEGVDVQRLSPDELKRREPSLAQVADQVRTAFLLPDEMQLRPPRHLRALVAACRRRGVELREHVEVRRIDVDRGRAVRLDTGAGPLSATHFCLATGPWAARLLKPLGCLLPVEPWRGQIILWKTAQPLLTRIVNEGYRYLIPREDGHLVVGATIEDVGFDCQTTEQGLEDLTEFSRELVPALRERQVERGWAGLRPMTPDGRPFLGRVPGVENLYLAVGHYRSGLHVAPATARLMRQFMLGERTEIDIVPFGPGR